MFDVAQKYVKELSKIPSIFKYRDMSEQEFQHIELIVTSFMNKSDHAKEITAKELEELEVNLTKVNGSEKDKIANNLVTLCQDYTIEQNARVIFVSSIPIILEGEEQGTFIARLD